MKKTMAILAILGLALLASSPQAADRESPVTKDQDESARKAKELRKERVAVLKLLVDQLTLSFNNAIVPYDDLMEATRLLHEAEVDAAETDKERVEIYKKLVAVLEKSESFAENRWKAGRGTKAIVLKMEARRLDAEIQLEKAKVRIANQGN
jgi:Outer membrane efflux protein